MRPRKLSKRQKLIIQKKKKEKARKPSTKKEKEKVFPGSGDLTSLGKGIITRTRESKEPDEGHQEEDLPGLEKPYLTTGVTSCQMTQLPKKHSGIGFRGDAGRYTGQ